MKIMQVLHGAGILTNFGTMGACSVTLVEDGGSILVDTGHFGNRQLLLDNLARLGLNPTKIDIVVLTHLNWDHCLNVDLFNSSRIMLSKTEFERGTLSGHKDNATAWYKESLKQMDLELVSEDLAITGNCRLLMTPGHTPGHMSVVCRSGKRMTVIAGDAIPNMRSYKRGIPDFVFHDKKAAKKSNEKVLGLHPYMIIPGHDDPFGDKGYFSRQTIDITLRTDREENLSSSIGWKVPDTPMIYEEI